MKRLEKLKKSIDVNSIIKLSISRFGQSFWLRLKSPSGLVEGKIHFPSKDSKRLLIFEPGFPGDGSTRLEKLWLNKLLKNGFTVFAVRHNGTIINGRYSNAYLNCPQKQREAKKRNQKLLGNKKKYTITDWLREPLIVLEALSSHFQEIYLMSHSFGTLATLSSLIDFSKRRPKHLKRIKRFISLAGSAGKIREKNDPILIQWLDYLNRSEIKKRIQIGDPKKTLETLRKTYFKIHKEGRDIPTSIKLFFLTPWGDKKDSTDELVHPIEAIDIITTLGRGYLFIDKTQRADKKTGRFAHDMDNLTPETLTRFLDKRFIPTQQISIIQ